MEDKISSPINHFRKILFWDVNPKKLDIEKSADFIIGRVLDFGNLKEWRMIKQLYGEEKIREATKGHVFTDPRSANFWSLILSIPINQIKCTRIPSLKIPNTFLSR